MKSFCRLVKQFDAWYLTLWYFWHLSHIKHTTHGWVRFLTVAHFWAPSVSAENNLSPIGIWYRSILIMRYFPCIRITWSCHLIQPDFIFLNRSGLGDFRLEQVKKPILGHCISKVISRYGGQKPYSLRQEIFRSMEWCGHLSMPYNCTQSSNLLNYHVIEYLVYHWSKILISLIE